MSAIVYLDTSALVKRAIHEEHTTAFRHALMKQRSKESVLLTSTLARVEVGRTLRRRAADIPGDSGATLSMILQGIALAQITDLVTELARTLDPPALRSLDAIHLATAIALGAHELWTYDDRLAEAARGAGITVRAPGHES